MAAATIRPVDMIMATATDQPPDASLDQHQAENRDHHERQRLDHPREALNAIPRPNEPPDGAIDQNLRHRGLGEARQCGQAGQPAERRRRGRGIGGDHRLAMSGCPFRSSRRTYATGVLRLTLESDRVSREPVLQT